MVAVADFMLDGDRMSWVPWPSLQLGAYGSFCAAFLPWTLAAYWLCSSLWHRPQSTRANFSACGTSLISTWQATHSRAAWGDAFKAAEVPLRLLNWTVGIYTMGAAPAWTCPFTSAGLVGPKPLAHRTIVSPGLAGVPGGVEVAVPMAE